MFFPFFKLKSGTANAVPAIVVPTALYMYVNTGAYGVLNSKFTAWSWYLVFTTVPLS